MQFIACDEASPYATSEIALFRAMTNHASDFASPWWAQFSFGTSSNPQLKVDGKGAD